jgi:DNA-binding winged helix-turn-helix (wHTH) protein/tetratricopeptide (TPR) repeat protein
MTTVRFGGYEVDLIAGEVRHDGTATRLQDKPLQLLGLLLEHPNALVTREQIRDRIWGNSKYHDFEDSLNQAVRKLREALGDKASKPRFVETIPRRGYRLMVPIEADSKSRDEPGQSSQSLLQHPIVGRRKELGKLLEYFDQASRGRGCLVCLSGEPGIGKTTLAETLLTTVTANYPCRIAVGRCSERFAGTEAYLPILEGFDSLLRSGTDDAPAVLLRETAPSWFAEMPPMLVAAQPPGMELPPEARAATQERRKREFVAFLESVTHDRPLLLFFDDLHWADPSSVDLLAYAAARAGSLPVLILATYRPSDLNRTSHPFLAAKRELEAHRLCRDIELNALAEDDVAALLDIEFPGHSFGAVFAAALYQRTEGHPLFLSDLVAELRSTGMIAPEGGRWVVKQQLDEARNLPDSIRAMVERQISHVTGEHRAVLEAAAVEGYQFHSALLSEVLKIDLSRVEDVLAELQSAHGLIRPLGEDLLPDSTFTLRYSFSHALYQNAVYGDIRPSRRTELSGAIARALLTHHRGVEGESALQLGHLFEVAREWQLSSGFLLTAARNSSRLAGHREAIRLCLHSIDIAGRMDGEPRDRRVLEATLQLAAARHSLSEFREALADWDAAESHAASLSDPDAQIQALCGAALSAGFLKRTDEMSDRAVKAISIAKSAGLSPAHPESVLGFQQIFIGDLVAARDNCERAVGALRQRGNSTPRAFATVTLGFLNDLQSEYRHADELFVEAMAQIRAADCWFDLLRATWFHGMTLANLGRLGDALQTLNKGMQLAELNGERYWYSRFPNTIGWVYGELLDRDSALRYNTDGVRAGREAGTLESEANSHINLANTYVALGELRRAFEHLSEGRRILNDENQKHWLRWRFHIRLELETANYWVAAGDPARARTVASAALQRAESALARKHVAAAHQLLGDAALLEDRVKDAAASYAAGLNILRRHPCALVEWKILRCAANAAALDRDHDRADRLLARAQECLVALAASLPDERLRQSLLAASPTARSAHSR